MTDKLNYQVDQLTSKVDLLHAELDALDEQVTSVEKNLLILKGEATVVEKSVASITTSTNWLFKIVSAGFVTAVIGWIIAGGLSV